MMQLTYEEKYDILYQRSQNIRYAEIGKKYGMKASQVNNLISHLRGDYRAKNYAHIKNIASRNGCSVQNIIDLIIYDVNMGATATVTPKPVLMIKIKEECSSSKVWYSLDKFKDRAYPVTSITPTHYVITGLLRVRKKDAHPA